MTNFKNTKKDRFLNNIPQVSLDDPSNDITSRCKFNFSYFDDSQPAGQKFNDWNHEQLIKLLNKLKEYSKSPLKYWQNQKIGSGEHRWNVLSIYDRFPLNSEFSFPKHIPHQARWARFRLEYSVRLIGFVIPKEYHKSEHSCTKECFDCNTFYIVFLDKNHKFHK